jgi:hypothetical protein
MATTIPFPFRNYLSVTLSTPAATEQLETIIEGYESALRDSDKAGDMEDHAYYIGLVDAYVDVLLTVLAVPVADVSTYFDNGQMPAAPPAPEDTQPPSTET